MNSQKPKLITELEESECFVFGSNESGFHGAGSAGYAFHGERRNVWRTHPLFQKAYKALLNKKTKKDYEPEDLRGNWAVLGETGFMEGTKGKSYGIITTEAPGKQGKVDDTYLTKEMEKLLACAHAHPEITFKSANFGLSRQHGGFSWWSPDQLKSLWETAKQSVGGIPPNFEEPEWATPRLQPNRSNVAPKPEPKLWDCPKSPELEM